MSLVWVVIIVVALGFAGAGLAFSKGHMPPVLRDVFMTGWEFFLLGAVVGPAGSGLIGPGQLEQLDPFIALGLGWAGLIFGSQLRLQDLKKVSREMVRLTLAQMAVVGVGIFILFITVVSFTLDIAWSRLISASCAVASALAISSPTVISIIRPRFPRVLTKHFRSLMIIATLDAGPAMVVIGLLFCFFPAPLDGAFSLADGVSMTFYSLVIATAVAGLFRLFDRDRLTDEENLAVFIGFLVFLSGIAFYLNLSPLFISLVTGIVLANTLPHNDRIYVSLHATEKPFYVIFLVVSGMWWRMESIGVWALALALVGARLWLKQAGVDMASGALFGKDRPAQGIGLALTAQGVLALAIGLNYLLVYPGEVSRLVFSVIAISTIVNEAIAPALVTKFMNDILSRDEP